jgi:hypothetical protein
MDEQRTDRVSGVTPQFSLRRLFGSFALICVGIPGTLRAFTIMTDFNWPLSVPVVLFMWFGSGACIGAGVFAPFKLTRAGVLIGLAAYGIIFGGIVIMMGMVMNSLGEL